MGSLANERDWIIQMINQLLFQMQAPLPDDEDYQDANQGISVVQLLPKKIRRSLVKVLDAEIHGGLLKQQSGQLTLAQSDQHRRQLIFNDLALLSFQSVQLQVGPPLPREQQRHRSIFHVLDSTAKAGMARNARSQIHDDIGQHI